MSNHEAAPKPIFNGGVYDFLKWASLVVFPALGAFYFTVGNIWHWPNVEEVIGTILAVEVFIGALIGVSTRQYNKSDAKYSGTLEVVEDHENGFAAAAIKFNDNISAGDLVGQKEVTFKVPPPA